MLVSFVCVDKKPEFSVLQGIISLNISHLFYLDTATRSRDRSRLDRRTDGQQSDPIRIPYLLFEVRDPINTSLKKKTNTK